VTGSVLHNAHSVFNLAAVLKRTVHFTF